MVSLKITTVNTRGLNDPVKCQTVFNYLHNCGGDLFLLQECSLPFMDNYAKFQKIWQYGQSFWSGDNLNRSTGVVVLQNNRTLHIESVEKIMDGRMLLIDIENNGCKMRLINVYGPTDLQERVFLLQTLQPYICSGRHIIIGGDFNCNLEKRMGITTAGLANKIDLSSHVLGNLINDFKLIDVFKTLHPEETGFTWTNGKMSSRIDFFFISGAVKPVLCTVDPVPFSDHHKLTCLRYPKLSKIHSRSVETKHKSIK